MCRCDAGTRLHQHALLLSEVTGAVTGEGCSGEHAYVAGAEFTVADILMTTVLRQARRAGLLAKYPRCEAYRAKCEGRPAWARTVAAYEARLGAEPGAVARAVEPI